MSAARLAIGKDGFSLLLELVTSTQAILARKRSGKSYTASVEAEELLAHKQQTAAINSKGAWQEPALVGRRRRSRLSCGDFRQQSRERVLGAARGAYAGAGTDRAGFPAIFDVGR